MEQQMENPTGDTGASTLDRIEAFLSGGDKPAEPQEQQAVEVEAQAETPEVDEQQPESEATEQTDEPQLSVTDLAKYLGVEGEALDVDDDGNVLIKTKIDGKEGAAKFQDLLKSYQLQGHIDNKARAAAEKEKALQDRESQFEARDRQRNEQFQILAQVAQQELMRDAQAIDCDALSHNDPAEFVAKQYEFQQRQARVNQLVQTALQKKQEMGQAEQQRNQQAMQAESERIPTLIPEWTDANVRGAEVKEVVDWSKSNGFSEQALSALHEAKTPDAAAFLAAMRKAMLYDKGKQSEAKVEKQVRLAPKLVKPGQSISSADRKNDSVRGLKDAIKKSGGKQGIAEYLMATGKV